MPRTHSHTVSTVTSAAALFRADRCLLAAACAAICGWALSLAWLWAA